MISRLVFRFQLRAKTALYFGGAESNQLFLSEEDGKKNELSADGASCSEPSAAKLIISGNAIGGVLRDWLHNRDEQLSNLMMGDKSKNEHDSFQESAIRIDDGELLLPETHHGMQSLPEQKGTAISAATGAAQTHLLYSYEYLPEGTEIRFAISCDSNDAHSLTKERLKQALSAWAGAINQGDVQFGGKKSRHYGVCEIVTVNWEAYDFASARDIDRYLFEPQRLPSSMDSLTPMTVETSAIAGHLEMKGSFPYGVFTGDFEDEEKFLVDENGKLLRAVIPSASPRGLIRHDIRRLILKVIGESEGTKAAERAEEYMHLLFGGPDRAGIITMHDLVLSGQEVRVERSRKEVDQSDSNSTSPNDNPFIPTYVKIDRITGGAVVGHLHTQHEAQGDGVIKLEIRWPRKDVEGFDLQSIWFPLVYALRRIGSGQLPIGGRTSIGLGIFEAESITAELKGEKRGNHLIHVNGASEPQTMEWLRESYEQFRRWCLNDHAAVE